MGPCVWRGADGGDGLVLFLRGGISSRGMVVCLQGNWCQNIECMGFFRVVFWKLLMTDLTIGMNSLGSKPAFVQVSSARRMASLIQSPLMMKKISPSTMLLRMKFSKDNLSISISDGAATSRSEGWGYFPIGLCDNEVRDATSVPGVSVIVHWFQMYAGCFVCSAFAEWAWALFAAVSAVYAGFCCESVYYCER